MVRAEDTSLPQSSVPQSCSRFPWVHPVAPKAAWWAERQPYSEAKARPTRGCPREAAPGPWGPTRSTS